jgi:hypothetical protein
MPQISLEIDQPTLERIEKIARINNTSISGWVGNSIKYILKSNYPEGFFDLFGAIKDETFVEPEEIDFKYDLPREHL